MKDSADSYEQKRWESAANSHARACSMLAIGALSQSYWHEVKERCEKEFPQLAKREAQ